MTKARVVSGRCIFERPDGVLEDGVYETDERAIEMAGLRLGLDFAAAVMLSKLDHLELVTAGGDGWDGVERPWSVL